MNHTLPVKVSERAEQELKAIYATKNIPQNYGVRIGIRGGGGCGGLSFILGFDQQKDTDDVFKLQGLEFYIEKKHLMYLIGVELDFEESAEERGFVFTNPLA